MCSDRPSECETICGDGVVAGSEPCDDGNAASGDGCEACVIEAGWVCGGNPSQCATICGDGLIAGSEQCDDGNTASGDGCSSLCSFGTMYGNYTEFPEPSSHSANYLLGTQVTVAQAGTLTHFGLFSKSSSPNIVMALYSDVGGKPGQLLAQTPATDLPLGPLEIPVPAAAIPAGTYWIMAVFDTSASVGIQFGGPDVVAYISHAFGAALPMSFPPPLTYTGQAFNYWIVLQ
jgi:cysteine-rich repeat protein